VDRAEHPFRMFLRNKLPMVICTDDSGVSRNDLSHEYMLLTTRYELSYPELKTLVYNSAAYSFLPQAEKAELKAQLDARFAEFEAEMQEYKAALGD